MRISIRVSWPSSLVLSVFVYVCLFSNILNPFYTTVSKAFLFLCLILSLIIVYFFLDLLYESTNVKFTVNAFFYYVTSIKALRQRLIFWVFVAGDIDRQRYYYIITNLKIYNCYTCMTELCICSYNKYIKS